MQSEATRSFAKFIWAEPAMLELHEINSYYQDSLILRAVSLRVPANVRIALVGRNGAGKTTLLKSIINAGPRVEGRIMWDGAELGKTPTHQRARQGLCLVPEDRRILGHLTVFENLRMAATGARLRADVIDPETILHQFPPLVPIRNRKAGVLSGGQQQILAIARRVCRGRVSFCSTSQPKVSLRLSWKRW